jgi:hypothetical protein
VFFVEVDDSFGAGQDLIQGRSAARRRCGTTLHIMLCIMFLRSQVFEDVAAVSWFVTLGVTGAGKN